MRSAHLLTFGLVLAAAPSSVTAQQRSWPTIRAFEASSRPADRSDPIPISGDLEPMPTGYLAAMGTLTAAGAFVGGIWLGARLEERYSPCRCDDAGLVGAIYGGLLAPVLAVPLAVHAANRGAGSLPAAIGSSILGGASAVALAALTHSLGLFVFGPPIAEVVGSVLAERR